METLVLSGPQINVHSAKSKVCLIESLGERRLLVTSIYTEALGKRYLYFFAALKEDVL